MFRPRQSVRPRGREPDEGHCRLAVVALLTLALGAPLRAQDKARDTEEIFKKALDAREKPNWAEAEKPMREAIGFNAKESPDKIKRGFERARPFAGTEYLPHFFLGEALFRQNDCAGAMAAWASSEQQGVVLKVERYAQQMLSGLAACEQKGLLRSPKFDQAVVAAMDDVAKAGAAVDSTRARGTAAGDLYTPERRAQVDEASKLTKEAQGRLDSARRTRAAAEFTELTNTTRRVFAILGGVDKDLRGGLGRARRLPHATGEPSTARSKMPTGSTDPSRTRGSVLTDGLGATRQVGREALGRARKASEAAHAAAAPGSIAEGLTAVGTATRLFREVLNEAIEIERRNNVALLAQELRAVRQKFSLLDGGFKNFDKRAAAVPADPQLAVGRQTLERRMRAGLQALNAAAKDGNAAAIQAAGKTADQISVELDRMLKTFGPLTIVERGVPEALANGARRFLTGDFTGALADLAPEGGFPADTPFLDHVYVFRAAARYELSLRAGADAPSHLSEARAAVAAMVGLNPRSNRIRARSRRDSGSSSARPAPTPRPPPVQSPCRPPNEARDSDVDSGSDRPAGRGPRVRVPQDLQRGGRHDRPRRRQPLGADRGLRLEPPRRDCVSRRRILHRGSRQHERRVRQRPPRRSECAVPAAVW